MHQSLIYFSKLLTWHLSSVLWSLCEISYTYDYSSRLGDHSKSVRFEKHDFKTLATGTIFGGYFNICDRLVWEFKSFLFRGIEMKLVDEITVCVVGSWNKINPFITKCNKNRQLWITFIMVSGMPYPDYDLWNNKADIIISYFNNNDWAPLVHWWQRQPAVENSMRRGD